MALQQLNILSDIVWKGNKKCMHKRTHIKNDDTLLELPAHLEFVEFFIIYSQLLCFFLRKIVYRSWGDSRCRNTQSIKRQIKCVDACDCVTVYMLDGGVCLLRALPLSGCLKLKDNNRNDNLLVRFSHNVNRMVTKICSIHGICQMFCIDEPQIQISHSERRHAIASLKNITKITLQQC